MKKIIILSLIIKAVTFPSNGLNYKEPQNIKKFFKEPVVKVQTPSVQPRRKEFTTQKELLDYLGAIHTTNDNTTMNLLGPTQKGNYIPVVLLAKEKVFNREKPTVMLIAQQHGNEPMGCDVLMATVKRVAKGDLTYLLDRINILIMPRINPDGAKKFTRDSAERKDINADHISLSTVEARSINKIYEKYNPEVFVDIHEYISDLKSYSNILKGEAAPYYDLLVLNPTNPNYSKELKQYTEKMLLQIKNIEKDSGYTVNYYYNPIVKPKKDTPLTLYEGTSDLSLARNMYGLKGSLSYLLELRGREIGFENVKRRLESGNLAVETILKDVYDNYFQIKETVKNERKNQKKSVEIFPEFVKEKNSIKLIDIDNALISEVSCIIIKTK
ncbi:MAG: M14 family zinc carboxypeptidase [Cetobacterium sp.]|uniref:M14 family zinc carboxypeptidase n=1 Tax=Cetobacterium sp. TaxID=2071632 RepID=UPI002FCC7DD0